jgi:regulator of sirC expression with transglutaminase-like and TPR domain
MDPTARFVELVSGPETAMPLDEAWFLVSAHARPELALDDLRGRLDALAGGVAEPSLEAVVGLLFEREGFGGNTADYYDPDNSFLDQVLDRHRGIPLSLSMLTIEVARRAGLSLDGVGMPGHFLVRTRNEPPMFVDPFGGGARLDVDGCAELFRRGQGAEAPFDVGLLDPVGPRAMLARLLANLRAIYHQRGDRRSLVWVLRLRSRIPGVPLADWRALASALASIGRFDQAAEELEQLAAHVGEEPADRLRARAVELRARLN